jgi:rhamnose utilization protein RhaD (predicted bifunctional aldolase and dehydrogenase)
MYEQEKKEMKAISEHAGARLDYVQGGGGNTSVKFDDTIMAIKASGYTLIEVDEDKGYVTVDYKKIINDYLDIFSKKDIDIEKESLKVNLDSVKLLDGMENKRPSVEVGFHSFLQKCVVHTHSTYSNILCCSEEGEAKAEEIFKNSGLGYFFIPFINPGLNLALYIKEGMEKFKKENGKLADIIFMESHGIITANDDYEKAIQLHQTANDMIRDYFKTSNFPEAKIKKIEDGYVGNTEFIKEFIKTHKADETYFDKNTLYPDEMVYLGEKLGKTILIDVTTGEITYKIEEKQALLIEQIILGAVFIIQEIEKAKMTLKPLCDEGRDFIKNWESEKYRASLVSK